MDSDIFDRFEEKREKGENDSYICSLIREDSVEEFVSFISRSNISLTSEVKFSIFETNSFLIENKETTLIEYSAFFGSIQIFQYLRMNGVPLTPSLWLYAIHSQNAEIIHLLESLNVNPPKCRYEECLFEAIKCHHNNIAEYFENNMIQKSSNLTKDEDFISCVMHYKNYSYFPSDIKTENEFIYLCCYDYETIIDLYIAGKEENIIEKISKQNITLQSAADRNMTEIIYYLLLNETFICEDFFQNNGKLKRIVIPSSITSINANSFMECSSLVQVFIPSSVTWIGERCFEECSSLREISIPSSVTFIGDYAFKGCSSLKEIVIPTSVTSIREYLFYGCVSLQKVFIPQSVTSIEDYSLFGCTQLKKIEMPSFLDSIGDKAFKGCTSLLQISIPSLVSSIGDYAFENCTALKQITIPSSLTSIGNNAFPQMAKIVKK